MKKNKNRQEIKFLEEVGSQAVDQTLKQLKSYSRGELVLGKESSNLIEREFVHLKNNFLVSLLESSKIADMSLKGINFNERRVAYFNKKMSAYKKGVLDYYPPAANAWVLDGLVFSSQMAGLKKLAGFTNGDGHIIDVLNSASSVALGAENPWLTKMDRVENHLGIKDNICTAYHPGLRQGFALMELAKLYPNKKMLGNLTVHSESSGTVVDSIAIESVVSYAEKKSNHGKMQRVLAIDGTWAGGYGSAREGTGFGIDGQQKKKSGKNIWVDRCLPPPVAEFADRFLKVLNERIGRNGVAGLYLEPDIVGDLGIVDVDPSLLRKVVAIMKKNKLPIIADCVQQLGRTGSYWGDNVETILKDYPLLVLTTAKSSSNGQPFGFTIMPKEIAHSAHALSQITTNQMNGPLLRVLAVSKILANKQFQKWLGEKSKVIERIASEYGFKAGYRGLRGKHLNRGVYVGDNELVKLAQIALLIEDGVLVGAVPQALRYQPMLMELSETNEKVAHIIFKRVKKIMNGEVSPIVRKAYDMMRRVSTGLARQNT
jgi:acetylornithine/succinyldiaminopimelate/putrescine aminotransferase